MLEILGHSFCTGGAHGRNNLVLYFEQVNCFYWFVLNFGLNGEDPFHTYCFSTKNVPDCKIPIEKNSEKKMSEV